MYTRNVGFEVIITKRGCYNCLYEFLVTEGSFYIDVDTDAYSVASLNRDKDAPRKYMFYNQNGKFSI